MSEPQINRLSALASVLGVDLDDIFLCAECSTVRHKQYIARHPYGPPCCVRCATELHGMTRQPDGSYE